MKGLLSTGPTPSSFYLFSNFISSGCMGCFIKRFNILSRQFHIGISLLGLGRRETKQSWSSTRPQPRRQRKNTFSHLILNKYSKLLLVTTEKIAFSWLKIVPKICFIDRFWLLVFNLTQIAGMSWHGLVKKTTITTFRIWKQDGEKVDYAVKTCLLPEPSSCWGSYSNKCLP